MSQLDHFQAVHVASTHVHAVRNKCRRMTRKKGADFSAQPRLYDDRNASDF